MPWDMYAQLTDEDLGHVLAYVRAVPRARGAPLPASSYSWATRWEMLRGRYPPEAFARLMHDGITIAGVESRSGLMTATARERFSRLRPDEVAALEAYLDRLEP